MAAASDSPAGTMDNEPRRFAVILGSASVARRKIMEEMGYEFSVLTADIDEKSIRKEKPEELVTALAEAKAYAIIEKLQKGVMKDLEPKLLVAADTMLPAARCGQIAYPTLLVTSDQVVVFEGAIREKPASEEEARRFIKDYSGRRAAMVTAVLVTNLKTSYKTGAWDRVEIYFSEIPEEVIDTLITDGTVLRVAGGLIIEHPLISPYVKEVVGKTDSVMGLPKELTERLIKEAQQPFS